MCLSDAHMHPGDYPQRLLSLSKQTDLLFCNSVSDSDWGIVEKLSEKDKRLIPFIAVHPWYVEKPGDLWTEELETRLKTGKFLIGEIGLDWTRPYREVQIEFFRKQLELAYYHNIPYNLHCVKAWGTLLDILKDAGNNELPFIIHWFGGSKEIMYELIELGAYISFSAAILDHRNNRSIENLKQAPEDRLLLETDFPYTARCLGRVEEKDYQGVLLKTYEKAAEHRNTDLQAIKSMVFKNAKVFADRITPG